MVGAVESAIAERSAIDARTVVTRVLASSARAVELVSVAVDHAVAHACLIDALTITARVRFHARAFCMLVIIYNYEKQSHGNSLRRCRRDSRCARRIALPPASRYPARKL